MIAAAVKHRWHPQGFDRKLHRHLARTRKAAAEHYKDALVTAITLVQGSDNTGDFITRFVGGMPKSIRIRWGTPYIHSQPGDLPYWVSRDTANAWGVAHARHMTVVGSASPVTRWLETGTTRMAPRPHILVTLLAESPAMLRIWATPL